MKAIKNDDVPEATTMAAFAFRLAPADKHIAGVYDVLSQGRLPPRNLKAANVQLGQPRE
jgi:hypothetical protein